MAFLATSISPATSSAGGGGTFRITGTALNTTTSVTFGGTAATSITVINANLMKVVAPAHAAGAVNVVITDGTTPTTLTGGYTYAADDAAEQLDSTLARKFKVEINTGTVSVPVWRQVRGIADLKPALETNLEDDSDYDSNGWKSQAKTQLGWSLELKLMRKKGFTSGAYDLGQERLRQASDDFPGTIQVRWYDRNAGPEAYTGYATVGWSPEGGDAKALDIATATLTGNGTRTDITNPAA